MKAVSVRHTEASLLLSLDDETWQPSRRLLDLSAQLAATAPSISHPILRSRAGGGPRWYEQFPGEHYNLLTAICLLLRPTMVWEFGTDRGMSTVALLEGLDPRAKVYTVDIDSWECKNRPWLVSADFRSGSVTQVTSDMKAPDLFVCHGESMAEAELVFVDGPKDGSTEAAFLDLLGTIPFRRNPIIVFDDTRLMNMVFVWRSIQRPKMDLTSFGHWSGTGLVDWCAPHA